MPPRSPRSFWCGVLHWHRWRMIANPDGEHYRACAIRRRDQDTSSLPIGG